MWSVRLHGVEKHSEPTLQDRGKEAAECRSRKKFLQKGVQKNPTDQRLHTHATFAAEIVFLTSVSTATSHAATIKQTGQPGCTPMIKLDGWRPYHVHRDEVFQWEVSVCFGSKYDLAAFVCLGIFFVLLKGIFISLCLTFISDTDTGGSVYCIACGDLQDTKWTTRWWLQLFSATLIQGEWSPWTISWCWWPNWWNCSVSCCIMCLVVCKGHALENRCAYWLHTMERKLQTLLTAYNNQHTSTFPHITVLKHNYMHSPWLLFQACNGVHT